MRSAVRQAAVLLGAVAVVLVVISVIAINGNARQGLRADILGPRRVEPGEAATYTVSVRDTAGVVKRVRLDFGDGRTTTLLDERDGACPPGPSTRSFDADHTYEAGGVYTARAEVLTGDCDVGDEQFEAVRTVQVKPLRR